jgi:hypothetical protein
MPTAPGPTVREGLAFRGKHWRLWVGTDGVVRFLIEGDHDLASIEDVLEAFGEIGGKMPERPVRILFYAHRTLSLSPDARERLVEACRAHLSIRVALVRPSPLAKIQARAIARDSAHEFTYHESEPDALKMLGAVPVATPPRNDAPPPPSAPDLGVVDYVS